MSAAIEASAVGKRYGRAWALRDCTLTVPCGRVVGLVGANGAGKSTLLNLAVGLLRPSEGHLTVLGERPGNDARQLGRVGFLAQAICGSIIALMTVPLAVASSASSAPAIPKRWVTSSASGYSPCNLAAS